MKKGVTIVQYGDGWQASVPVVHSEFVRLPGVKGTQNEHGPWIGGFGATPDEALRELHTEIGRILLPALLLPRTEGDGLTWSNDDEEDDEPDEDDMIDALVEIHEVARKSLPSMASVCIDQTSGTAASRPAEAVKDAAPGCIGAPLADRDPVSAPFVPSDPRNERFERAKEEWLKVTGEDVSHLQCPSEARRAIPCTCSSPALHEIDCPYVQACAPYGRCSKCNKPLTLPPSMPGIGPSTCGDCWRASQRTNDARMRCEHEWQHRCGKCGEPSELDGCTETERSSAIAAFRKIASLTEHDSPIDQVVQEAVAVLLHEQDQCTDNPTHAYSEQVLGIAPDGSPINTTLPGEDDQGCIECGDKPPTYRCLPCHDKDVREAVEEAVDHYVADDGMVHCRGCVMSPGTKKCPGMPETPLPVEPDDHEEALELAQSHIRAALVFTRGHTVGVMASDTATNDLDAAHAYIDRAMRPEVPTTRSHSVHRRRGRKQALDEAIKMVRAVPVESRNPALVRDEIAAKLERMWMSTPTGSKE